MEKVMLRINLWSRPFLSPSDRPFPITSAHDCFLPKRRPKADNKVHKSTIVGCFPVASEKGNVRLCPVWPKMRHKKTGLALTNPEKSGRGDRIWTCDLLVPNQTRYQTALHLEIWSRWRDSNPWPADYESAALPTEPHRHAAHRRWQ